MQIFFTGKCLFEYKIRFEVEKKNEKIFGASSTLLGNFFKKLYENCMISIFPYI